MAKFLDTEHPMFRPLWVRILIVAAAAGWGVVELATGSPSWAMIFLALAAYSGWHFFVTWNPGGGKEPPQQ